MLTLSAFIVAAFKDYTSFIPGERIKQGHLFEPERVNERLTAAQIRAKLDEIRGHLVDMPLDFLKDAVMAETGLQVNAYTEVRLKYFGDREVS